MYSNEYLCIPFKREFRTIKKLLMKKILFLLLICVSFVITSCTEQSMAKNYGGRYDLKLPKGKKLIIATWKDSELWCLTRDMKDDETPEIYEFIEDSNYDVFEGKVVIIETK